MHAAPSTQRRGVEILAPYVFRANLSLRGRAIALAAAHKLGARISTGRTFSEWMRRKLDESTQGLRSDGVGHRAGRSNHPLGKLRR